MAEPRFRDRLPEDAPARWVDPACRYCEPGAPCVMHDKRPASVAANRVIFGPSFGYEPTVADYDAAGPLIPSAHASVGAGADTRKETTP